uniref:Spermatogenesis-associated protein 4 n=1 Tax=Hanusia phi TaxID=3032 RepID=A0A7S0E7K1_9CRYP
MSGLSRDILKWIQSLDLSYSVKNVKRDFSNGFLVAEIFSRYFPHDVQMHSYDNGMSLQKKLANWELLQKFFMKKGVPISREMIDQVIHCKDNASIPLLETIYTCLTSKKVQNVQAKNEDELIPPFARATASSAIKESIKDTELVTTLQDENTSKNRTAELLSDYNKSLRSERILEPGRFTTTSPKKSQRVPPRPMPSEVPQGQIEFKEVQVRTIDRNVTQLRASRDVGGTMNQSSMGDSRVSEEAETKALMVKPITKQLNEIVKKCMGDGNFKGAEGGKDAIVVFLDMLVSSKDPNLESAASFAFETMVNECDELVNAFLASPKEFWRMFALFNNTFFSPESSLAFSHGLQLFCEIGQRMTLQDPFLACGLFGDYGIPKIVPLLKTKPAKRRSLLSMMYCFCETSMHLRMIKALQDGLEDMTCFLQCVVILMHLETSFTEDLLDLYIYYAMTGLGQQSASLRAAALSMVVIVVEQQYPLVIPMLDKLELLRDDGWWEVSAQLLRVCAAILSVMRSGETEESVAVCGRVYTLTEAILTSCRSPLVKKIAVSSLAPVLEDHPSLKDMYRDVLLSLNERDFSAVMSAPKDQQQYMLGSSLQYMQAASPLTLLPPLMVAQTLAIKIKESELENLEPEHVYTLLSVLEAPFQEEEIDVWSKILEDLELHVYVALADEELCADIVSVIHKWVSSLGSKASKTFTTLGKSLKLIFTPEGDSSSPAACQDAAMNLLGLLRQEESVKQDVEAVLKSIKADFQGTNLESYLNQM